MNEQEIKRYARSVLKEHTDPLTDEINLTYVEEDVIDHFDLHNISPDELDDLSWWVFQVTQ